MKKYVRNICLLFTLLVTFIGSVVLVAQDSFNTNLLIESYPTAGEYTLVVDSPKNGTYFNEVNIVWFSDSLNKFSLYYNIDSNYNWEIIEEGYIDSSEYWYNFNWQFQNLSAENVKIKVSSFYDTNIFDISSDITLKSRIAISDSTYDSLYTFYPLEVGNVWQYKVTNIIGYQDFVNKDYDFAKVLSDTTIGNKKYFKVETIGWGDNVKYLRYDSLQNSIIRYYYNEEVESFKLDSKTDECWFYEGGKEICNRGSYLESIFGLEKPIFYYSQSGFNSKYFHLAKDFGPVWIANDQSYINTDIWNYDLVYAKIGGIEYGTYVSVEDGNDSAPNDYSLSQNYPNPFNPSTTISYSLSQKNFVQLKVYDVLGKEVTTLVNKEQPAGTYEVDFNASNLATGIYFYKMITAKFSETQKMIYLK